MSLVGSLEDLGLGDILQIVSLSRKSGLLLLRSDQGEARIVFRDGLVRAAFVKGEAEDLRSLLLSGGFVDAGGFDRAVEIAEAHSDPVVDTLAALPNLSKERIDSLRREHVERSVFHMFTWKVGEFSFEIRDEIDVRDRDLLLTTGINAQYLTMEATRLGDEREMDGDEGERDGDDDLQFGMIDDNAVAEGSDTMQFEVPAPSPEFGEGNEAPQIEGTTPGEVTEATDALALAIARRVDDSGEFEEVATAGPSVEALASGVVAEPIAEPDELMMTIEFVSTPAPPATPASETAPAAEPTPVATTAETIPAPAPASTPEFNAPLQPNLNALVLIDPDLTALEWQRSVLGPISRRIHIFQRADSGIARIRQYLRRGEQPCVLVSCDLPADPMGGIGGSLDLTNRLRAHSPRMPIFLVHAGADQAPSDRGAAQEILRRPANHHLANRRSWAKAESEGEAIRQAIQRCVGQPASENPAAGELAKSSDAGSPAAAVVPVTELRRLKQMSDRLRDPSVRGEVLSLVLEFAAESFARVAIFMVRDDEALGMAQSGLELAGGPSNEDFCGISFPAREPRWFREVLDRREGVTSQPTDPGDYKLAALIGEASAAEAYVAPIESNQQVVAVVYGDNLPDGAPIGETDSLEIVLHEAGLALERALLERALAEASNRDGS